MKDLFRKFGDVLALVAANIVFHLKGMDAKMPQLQEELRQERLLTSNLMERLSKAEAKIAELKRSSYSWDEEKKPTGR